MGDNEREALERFVRENAIPSMERTAAPSLEIHGIKENELGLLPGIETKNPKYYFTLSKSSVDLQSGASEAGFYYSGDIKYTVVLRKKDRGGS